MKQLRDRYAWNSSVKGNRLSPHSPAVKVLRLMVEGGGTCNAFPPHVLPYLETVVRRGWAREVGDDLEITLAGREAYEQVTAVAGKVK